MKLVIMGRPNVGKSTLFNRLLGRRRALVHDEPGVTRDRMEEKAEWWVKGRRVEVDLVDTGGLGGDRFALEIEKQVKIALSEADIALMVFDGRAGLTSADQELILELNQSGVSRRVPILGVVNKIDAESHESMISEFFETGLSEIVTISAEHGRGMDDLQEKVVEMLGGVDAVAAPVEPEADPFGSDGAEAADDSTHRSTDRSTDDLSADAAKGDGDLNEEEEDASGPATPKTIKVAIVGRPNVGKSTFLNALAGKERMITSPIAGTTVDAVDSLIELGGREFLFIDTAGIRRKSKTEQGIEVLSVVQARKALERADIAILVVDGETGITDQDEKIGGLIEEVGCGVILAVNKWDTQYSTPEFTREMAADNVREKMAYLRYAPILFTSAIRGQGFRDLPDLIEEIVHQRKLKIPTHEFTEWVKKESTIHNPFGAKFYMSHQSGRNPPTFVCHVNHPDKVHFSLRRHLVNALRERWGFMGSPVRLLFVETKSKR